MNKQKIIKIIGIAVVIVVIILDFATVNKLRGKNSWQNAKSADKVEIKEKDSNEVKADKVQKKIDILTEEINNLQNELDSKLEELNNLYAENANLKSDIQNSEERQEEEQPEEATEEELQQEDVESEPEI
ncbi:MAG: hypothetical protein IKF17_03325 [Clostridia bacterium]|nr:hypothetical protein [Clostridia bacterium]